MPDTNVIAMPGAMSPIERIVNTTDNPFEINMGEVIRYVDGICANDAKDAPIELTGTALSTVKRWIETYGFERLPKTFAELNGLRDYCLDLETAWGAPHMPEHLRKLSLAAELEAAKRYWPEMLRDYELFFAGDIEGLRQLHREQDTLTRLGRDFEPSYDVDEEGPQ